MARLRFDRVALRFVPDVRVALSDSVPEGKTLIVTVTAPVRVSSKTAAELVDKTQRRIARHPKRLDVRESINGNQIRVRLATGTGRRTPNVVGFVHNPDVDAVVILDVTQSMLASP